MIKYLITGGSGFIGTNLRKWLEARGLMSPDDFVNIDISPNDTFCIEHDICEAAPPTSAKHIVHLAAFTDVRKSINNPSKAFLENCYGTVNCLDLAKETGANSFVFASSVAASKACSPYGASKLAGEAICRAYRESYGMNVRILRLSNVYGPYSTHKSSVIAKFIKQIINEEPLQIYGSGEQTRDFVFVSDVVQSIISLNRDPWNLVVATGQQTSILTLTEMLSELSHHYMGYKPEIEHLPPNRGEVLHSQSSTDITPEVNLEEGLRKTFVWFLENKDRSDGYAI